MSKQSFDCECVPLSTLASNNATTTGIGVSSGASPIGRFFQKVVDDCVSLRESLGVRQTYGSLCSEDAVKSKHRKFISGNALKRIRVARQGFVSMTSVQKGAAHERARRGGRQQSRAEAKSVVEHRGSLIADSLQVAIQAALNHVCTVHHQRGMRKGPAGCLPCDAARSEQRSDSRHAWLAW